jgi:predicted secreted hydrolase
MRAPTALLAAGALLAGCASIPLHQVPADRQVELPDDHGPHDWAQTEWWHVHAHMTDVETGEPVDLFAGFVVERTDLDRAVGLPIAPVVNPYHVAYVQVVAADGARTSARYNWPIRDARFEGDGLDLRHTGQRIAWERDTVVFEGRAGRHKMRLKLLPTQPETVPGDGGAIEIVPGTRHLWYQAERMEVSGLWQDGGTTRWVEGTGFFKHQWGRLYDPDVEGFEWFSMDLPDDRSLVVVLVHEGGRRGVPGSRAFVTERGGRPVPLDVDAIDLRWLKTWRSPRTGARWPVAWHIEGAGLDLVVETAVDDQELTVFPAPFYAGPARARGTVQGEEVDVVAFVEHVGGFQPALRPLYRSDPPPGAIADGGDR